MNRLTGVALLTGVMLLMGGCSKESPKPLPDPLVEVYLVPNAASHAAARSSSLAVGPEARSEVLAQSSGTVESVLVQAGDRVTAGQALVRLDPVDARLADSSARVQIAAAAAQLASAEADFARYARLRDQNFISQAEFERREAAVLAARAEHEARLDGLGLISSRALSAGVVQKVLVSKGQRLKAGAVLLVLSGAAAQKTGSLGAGPGAGLVSVQASRIPLAALINGGQAVMVVEQTTGGTRARLQSVTVLASDDRWAQVSSGLKPGDRVVALGAHLLTDGQSVRLPGQSTALPSSPTQQR
jgi:multidrug efflux pump subunit AcrA (membrane-fusion protein)